MRKLIVAIGIVGMLLATYSCQQNKYHSKNDDSVEIDENEIGQDPNVDNYPVIAIDMSKYRDTIVGKFDGLHVDTLISEPVLSMDTTDSVNESIYEPYFHWRVFTVGGTVKDLEFINRTIRIKFISEGDLDGDGCDDWGFITAWPTSNWMKYNIFSYVDGYWAQLIEPTSIFIPHVKYSDSDTSGIVKKEDLASRHRKKGYLNVKFSDIRNNGEDFLVIDTVMVIPPKKPITVIQR